MHYQDAVRKFTKHELRGIARARKLRWYSYLTKIELAFRLFGMDSRINRGLCQLNQLRRYRIRIPDQQNQWEVLA